MTFCRARRAAELRRERAELRRAPVHRAHDVLDDLARRRDEERLGIAGRSRTGSRSAPLGSSATGRPEIPCSFNHASTVFQSSSVETARNSTFASPFVSPTNFTSSGISSRQGGHHVAQKCRISPLPVLRREVAPCAVAREDDEGRRGRRAPSRARRRGGARRAGATRLSRSNRAPPRRGPRPRGRRGGAANLSCAGRGQRHGQAEDAEARKRPVVGDGVCGRDAPAATPVASRAAARSAVLRRVRPMRREMRWRWTSIGRRRRAGVKRPPVQRPRSKPSVRIIQRRKRWERLQAEPALGGRQEKLQPSRGSAGRARGEGVKISMKGRKGGRRNRLPPPSPVAKSAPREPCACLALFTIRRNSSMSFPETQRCRNALQGGDSLPRPMHRGYAAGLGPSAARTRAIEAWIDATRPKASEAETKATTSRSAGSA